MFTALLKELFKANMYKVSQGKIARRLTMIGLLIIFATGTFCIYRDHMFGTPMNSLYVGLVTFMLGAWFSYRLINFPPFADFLISVEAEMTKVSWPSKVELLSTSKVVLVFMFLFIAIIYVYDIGFDMILSVIKRMLNRG